MANTNKKKVRGWRRQIKKIDFWYNSNFKPNVIRLESCKDEYAKIWIDPWYRLSKRNPPLWYFRIILDRIGEMHNNWKYEFLRGNIPFDLQLWIFEKNYIESELVCARVDDWGLMHMTYFQECNEERQFPISIFSKSNFNYERFVWELAFATRNYYDKSDFLTEKDIEQLLNSGYTQEIIFENTADEQRRFWKKYDYVWIGREKP